VNIRLRRAEAQDAEPIAGILVGSRERNPDTIPAMVHSPEEVLTWVRSVVIPQRETWVASAGDAVVGVLVLDENVIDQLYVRPSRTRHGFTEVELTDGSGNEEREPDVRLAWQPDL
jgi:hypothetical protein